MPDAGRTSQLLAPPATCPATITKGLADSRAQQPEANFSVRQPREMSNIYPRHVFDSRLVQKVSGNSHHSKSPLLLFSELPPIDGTSDFEVDKMRVRRGEGKLQRVGQGKAPG